MTIYRLKTVDHDKTFDQKMRWTGKANYCAGDAFSCVLVRATSEEYARQMASFGAREEGGYAWTHKSTKVEEYPEDGESEWLGSIERL